MCLIIQVIQYNYYTHCDLFSTHEGKTYFFYVFKIYL
jgi:hypothetical protein